MVQSSGLYLVTIIGYRLVSLILFPVISRRLTPSEYGALDLLDQITSVTGVLLGSTFSWSLGYFYSRDTPADPAEALALRSRVVGTTLGGAALMGLVAACLGLLATPFLAQAILRSHEYTPYLYLAFVGLPLTFTVEACLGWLRVENRAAVFTWVSMLRILITLAGILILVGVMNLKIWGMLVSNIAAAAVLIAVTVTICTRSYHLRFDPRLFWQMFVFSLPLSLSSLALFTLHFGDRFILPRYRSMAELGVYALAYKFGMLISLVHSSFDSYWGSQIYVIVKRDDARKVFGRVFTYMVTVLAFAALGILVAAKPAVHLLAVPSYYGALALIPIILAAYFTRAMGDFFRAIFYALGKPSYDAVFNWTGASISLGGYILLIPKYGAMGAAVATLAGFLFLALLCPIWVYRIWPYRVELDRLAKLAAVTCALIAIFWFFPPQSVLMEIVQGLLLLLAFPVLLFILRFPAENELNLLRSLKGRLLPNPTAARQ